VRLDTLGVSVYDYGRRNTATAMLETAVGDRRAPLGDPARLRAVHRVALMDTPPEIAFDRLTQVARHALGVPVAFISLVDDRREFFKSQIGLPEAWVQARQTPVSGSFGGLLVEQRAPLVVSHVQSHASCRELSDAADLHAAAYLGMPLVDDGQVIGSFTVVDVQPREWSEDEVRTLANLAACVISEIELRAARAGYEYMLERATDIIYRTDQTGHFSEVNLGALNRLHYARDELIGRHYLDLIHTSQRSAANRFYRHQFARRLPNTYFEFRALAGDGSEVWLGQNVQLIVEAGEVVGFEAIARDITERKQAEAELQALVERYRLVNRATNDALWDWDLATNEVAWNAAVQTIFGYAEDDVDSSIAWRSARINPLDAERVQSGIAAALGGTDEDWSAEYRFRRADGQYATVLDRAFIARDEHGTPVRMIGSMQDVTATRQAEEERLELRAEQAELAERAAGAAALQEGEQKLRLALTAARMGSWEWDFVTRRVAWSDEAKQMMGIAPGPPTSEPESVLTLIHPDDRSALAAQLEAVGNGAADDLAGEYRIETGNAPTRWIAVQGRVFRDRDGQRTILAGVVMDVTERKLSEQRAEVLARTERLRALGQMASGIAHDLNQSLALISGYSEVARQELESDEPDLAQLRDMFAVAVQATQDAAQAVKTLLDFARMQQIGKTERLDVSSLLREVARLTAPRWRDHPQVEGRSISLRVEAAPGLIVDGSAASLREALTNLVFNAVDALPNGGGITLAARDLGERVAVEVQDTGVGMPPEVQARALEAFFTTKGARGTGLGLAQVATITQQHGGTVLIDSAPGRGTTVRLLFPLASPVASVADQGDAAREEVRSVRILVVDDEDRLTSLVARVLSEAGHQVTTAASGEDALAALGSQPFDLVISDLGLGEGMNGWDLAKQVAERWSGTRFVLATGWGASIDPDEARERFVDAVVAKPYRIAELRQLAADVPPR
jgi:PAS domain S-box-containing protein